MAYRWKQWEVTYLFDHCQDGLQAISEKLGRSEASVRNQASRYGVSLRVRHICPKCGEVTHYPISPLKGWCKACCIEASRDRALKANQQIRQEVVEEERRLKALERERQAYYASTHRYKKKLRRLRESQDDDGK